MRKTFFFVFLVFALIADAAVLSVDPWIMPGGRLSVTIGWPSLGVRFGLLNFLEFGGSVRELGVYMKAGFKLGSFGVGGGISMVPGMATAVFGSAGYQNEGFEIVGGGYVSQSVEVAASGKEYGYAYSFSTEVWNLIAREKNSIYRFGAFFRWSYERFWEEEMASVYEGALMIQGDFKDVWIFKGVILVGGLNFFYNGKDPTIDLVNNLGVSFSITASVDLFK